MPNLPNELLGVVVDRLRDAFDWTTIQTMSLVSPDLRFICQRLLCESLSITLLTDGSTTTAHRLNGLAKTPRLTSYVRSFRLALPEATQEQRAIWILEYGDLLVQVLQLLPLEQLEALCSIDWQDICLGSPWESSQLKSVRRRLQKALQSLLQAPIISLSTTHQPIEKFQQCGPSLKHIVVCGTSAQYIEDIGLSDQPLASTIELETLESHDNTCNVNRHGISQSLISIHQYFVHPSSPFTLRSLKRLVWKNGDRCLEDLRLVMQSCTHSLQCLDLRIDPWTIRLDRFSVEGPPTALIWAQDQLRHLDVQGYINLTGVDTLLWLHCELARREGPYEHLHTISVRLCVTELYEWEQFVGREVDEEWRLLSEALANRVLYPSLKAVRLHIFCQGWEMRGNGSVVSLLKKEREIRRVLSSLDGCGILAFNVTSQTF